MFVFIFQILSKTEREKTKGKEWFGMPTGELTEEAKNDLMLIKMRSGLHKDKFFKSNDSDALPKYFQVLLAFFFYLS